MSARLTRLRSAVVAPTLARAAVATAALGGGCIEPELTRSTDLAHLEVASLEMYIGSYVTWGELRPVRALPDPCAVLGTDFHARVNAFDASTYPGGREEVCTSPTTSQPCEEQPARCAPPYFDVAWPPPLELAKLVIADRSREIACNLGDAFAPRTITRVDGTWDVERGEQMTVRVSPATDVNRFAVDVYFAEPNRPTIDVPFTVAGDTVTFRMPTGLDPGTRTLYVHLDGDEDLACDVPAHALHSYVIEQPLSVR